MEDFSVVFLFIITAMIYWLVEAKLTMFENRRSKVSEKMFKGSKIEKLILSGCS